MTPDERGAQLVDRLNAILTATGLPEESGAALMSERDVEQAVAVHLGLPAEVVRNLIGATVEVGVNGMVLGANLQQSFGGVAAQAMLLGALAMAEGEGS